MQTALSYVTISHTQACPLYAKDDQFDLTGHALFPPENKPVCLIAANDIYGRLFPDLDQQPNNISFECSGCTGKVTLFYTKDDPQGSDYQSNRQIDNIARILSGFSMFQSIEPHQTAKLVNMLKLSQYRSGDFILRKGEPGRRLYIILNGVVEVVGENETTLAVLTKGEVFGEMSLLSGDPVTADIKVIEPTKILYFQSQDFRRVLNRFPSLQLYLAKLLTKRLAKTNADKLADSTAGISGTLSDTPPPEICQTINLTQKTGILTLHLPGGDAAISFRDGNIVRAEYGKEKGKNAFFEILKDTEGRFSFQPGLSPEDMQMNTLGHFMCLLMEGVSLIDESSFRSK